MAQVGTNYGALRGTEEAGVQVFRGIPFAKPPVGPLRFRPPERPDAWAGVRDATRFGPGAYQSDRPLAPLLGIIVPEQSEDCLYLNVWTPAADGARRPVLVWIHGGAWVIGAGSEVTYDGASLARRGDVVVVTVNYRLGVFGYLRAREATNGALDTTGNEAMLDLVAALTWVRDEIAAFGGDPNNVTVLGESAGSANTACLLTMPRARGLCHKAIMQSGALNLLQTPQAAGDVGRAVLAELGLAPEQAAQLRELPAATILAAGNRVAKRPTLVTFAPVADGEIIPERPEAAVADGSARGIPLLAGTNRDEMKLYGFFDPGLPTLDEAGLLARVGAMVADPERVVAAYRANRAARGESTEPVEMLMAISTDQVFRGGTIKVLDAHAAHTPQTYAYLFTWEATLADRPRGAVHGLDLPFVFGTLDTAELGRWAGRTPAAYQLSESMQDAWVAFARTGRPAASDLPAWEPYRPAHRATMRLGERCELVDVTPELVDIG